MLPRSPKAADPSRGAGALPTRTARWLLALLLVTLAACGSPDDGLPSGVIAVEAPLPTVTGETLQGGQVSTSAFDGRPLVVNVWATWCGPCLEELPILVDAAARYEGRVGFLGVNYVDDETQARRWVEDYAIPYPSISDRSGSLADDLGFPYLPHTLLVDGSGTIRYRIYGETSTTELAGLLDELLADP